MSSLNLLQTLQKDYESFPENQTYTLYADDVYFKDPMSEFRGRDRYQSMISFIKTWFLNVKMDLHNLQHDGETIRTDWTLSWNTPLPWKPHISISGWSELTINAENLIVSHIDYWNCSRLNVLKQHFR